MAALHRTGGVPPGWQLTPRRGDATAGRQAFTDLGCPSCHAVAGETVAAPAPSGRGPELTGMGGHHPPGYFVEAILNPDAVLVDGPGWVTADGRSTMPSYPDITVTQLEDLVAYLSSLDARGPHVGPLVPTMTAPAAHDPADLPAAPSTAARAFFAQSYDVAPGRAAAFEEWFRTDGARGFLAIDGLLAVDTFVDTTRTAAVVTTVWSFRDDDALAAFASAPDAGTLAVTAQFDGFLGPHDHELSRTPPVYRVPSLSAP